MRIELTSTLTQEDENRLAPAILRILSGMLDMLPVAYMVRVETTDEHLLQHISPHVADWESGPRPQEPTRPVAES